MDRTIRIRYPLAIDIAGPLVSAIGALWPDGLVRTDDPRHLAIDIPAHRPKRVAKAKLREALTDDPLAAEVEIAAYDGHSITATTPQDAMQALAEIAYTVLASTKGAANYVEQKVAHTDAEGVVRRLVVITAWSEGQTPHELRMAAEARADAAEARLRELTNA